jgi:hypothetical protein
MKRTRHSAGQIVANLRQADVELGKGSMVPGVCKLLGVTEPMSIRWPKEYGGLMVDQAKRFKRLEQEKRTAQSCGREPGGGQRDPEGSRHGKPLSPAHRRIAVGHVKTELGVSERRACRVLGQARAVRRHRDDAVALEAEHDRDRAQQGHKRDRGDSGDELPRVPHFRSQPSPRPNLPIS